MSNEHIVHVSNRKYTFHKRGDGKTVDVLRHGKPWITLHDGFNAIASIMAELDAARVVLDAARNASYLLDNPRDDDAVIATRGLAAALRKHGALVDDIEQPSAWAGTATDRDLLDTLAKIAKERAGR